jgi:hypothetical protein
MLPNTILAGTNKSGTTSLFRYLSDHPEVSASKIKEVRFFSTHNGELSPKDLEIYHSYFPSNTTKKITLEASPCYLAKGEGAAANIFKHVPDVKLIFVLRDPVGRLFSAYRRRKERQDKLLAGVGASDYVNLLLDPEKVDHVDDKRKAIFQSELRSVCYGELLKPYFEIFGPERIHIGFFDDLSAETHQFMCDVASYLGIDPAFYNDYTFNIENKTLTYRSKTLQKLVFTLNMLVEPALNKMPRLKNRIRELYNLVNESKSKPGKLDQELNDALSAYFKSKNRALKSLLEEHSACRQFPAWLQQNK